MQRGLGNPQARGGSARKDTVAAIAKKFSHMQTSFQREGVAASLKVVDSGSREAVQKLVERKIAELSGEIKLAKNNDAQLANVKAQLNAWNMWKVQYEADVLKQPNNDATKDFFAWLLGKGKEEHHRRTPWYRDQALVELDDVRAWIDGFADVFTESVDELKKLAWKTPQNLDEAWLYFKFIVQTDWMKREDRFFWVDLVNLMEEKAKLGGGLTKEEMDIRRPYLRVDEQDGGETLVPLTQEDAFAMEDPNLGVLNKTKTQDAASWREDPSFRKVVVDLRRQLATMAGMPDPRERHRDYIRIAPEKLDLLKKRAHDYNISLEQAEAKAQADVVEAEAALRDVTDPTVVQEILGGLEDVGVLLAGIVAPASLFSARRWFTSPTMLETLPETDKQKMQQMREALDQVKSALESRAIVDPVPAYVATNEDLQVDLEEFRRSLDDVIAITKLPEEHRRRFEQARENVATALRRVHVEQVRTGVVESGMDPGEIPAYLAVTAELVSPDVYSITRAVDEAMKRTINASPDLKEKLAATKDKHRLTQMARMSKLMETFIHAQELATSEVGPRPGTETAFLQEVLADKWQSWLKAASIDGEVLEQFRDLPRDAFRMHSMYKALLDGVRSHSELLYKFLRTSEGGYLAKVYSRVLDGPGLERAEKFSAKLEKYQAKLGETVLFDVHERLQILDMQKTWKAWAAKTNTQLLGAKTVDWFGRSAGIIWNTGKRMAKAVAVNIGGQLVFKGLQLATPGAPAFAVSVGLMMAVKQMLGFNSYASVSSFLMGALTNSLALGVGGPKNGKLLAMNLVKNNLGQAMAQSLRLENAASVDTWVDSFLPWAGTIGTTLALASGLGLVLPGALAGTSALGGTQLALAGAIQYFTSQQNWIMGGDLNFIGRTATFLANWQVPAQVTTSMASVTSLMTKAASGNKAAQEALETMAWTGAIPARGMEIPKHNFKLDAGSSLIPNIVEKVREYTHGETPHVDYSLLPKDLDNIKYYDPVTRAAFAYLSSEYMQEWGKWIGKLKYVESLGFGAADLFRSDISIENRYSILANQLLTTSNALAIFGEINQVRVQVFQNIIEMEKVDAKDLYFEYVNRTSQQRVSRRMQDMQSRRRLKEPNPKRPFLKKLRETTDKRTGEGLVKREGATRVAVQ